MPQRFSTKITALGPPETTCSTLGRMVGRLGVVWRLFNGLSLKPCSQGHLKGVWGGVEGSGEADTSEARGPRVPGGQSEQSPDVVTVWWPAQ